jgi:hypothetical protein
MRELDKGREGRMMLNDGSVAEGPVVAASCAGAGGTDSRSPDDDGNVIGEYCPGEAPQRGGRAGCRGSGNGGGDHARCPKLNFMPLERFLTLFA